MTYPLPSPCFSFWPYFKIRFGHQDHIESIDTLHLERCVTAGSRDRTVRLWKIIEESQLVFRGISTSSVGSGSGNFASDIVEGLLLPSEMELAQKEDKKRRAGGGGADGGSSGGSTTEVVAYIDEDTFLSGTDSG